MPRIVAEIGAVGEQHMKSVGVIQAPNKGSDACAHRRKRAAYEKRLSQRRWLLP
jgi:hypothetical protein